MFFLQFVFLFNNEPMGAFAGNKKNGYAVVGVSVGCRMNYFKPSFFKIALGTAFLCTTMFIVL